MTSVSDLPHAIRRAFRLSTGGKPGPVHVRIPSTVLEMEANEPELEPQIEFSGFPAQRPIADKEAIRLAVSASKRAPGP